MPRWAMVIDLRKCVGCKTCSYACQGINKVLLWPQWRQVDECEVEGFQGPDRIFLPRNCMHCSEAPCLSACPTGATYRRSGGIIDIDYDLCIGCGSCIVACPYHARAISYRDETPSAAFSPIAEGKKPADRVGICTKCNFCIQRVELGLEKGLRPGIDPEASPVCVNCCIAGALSFGDLGDPESNVSQLIKENNTLRLHEELGTEPSIYYILE